MIIFFRLFKMFDFQILKLIIKEKVKKKLSVRNREIY